MEGKPRPYIIAALLCEKILEEKDGSLTIVRIADRIEWEIVGAGQTPAAQGIRPTISITGLLSLKSGPVKGEFPVQIKVVKPNGELMKEVFSCSIKLLGGDHGQNTIINISLAAEQEGLHWFDVYFDDDLLTRIPLMVVKRQQQEMAMT
jgi:hypothetical protein